MADNFEDIDIEDLSDDELDQLMLLDGDVVGEDDVDEEDENLDNNEDETDAGSEEDLDANDDDVDYGDSDEDDDSIDNLDNDADEDESEGNEDTDSDEEDDLDDDTDQDSDDKNGETSDEDSDKADENTQVDNEDDDTEGNDGADDDADDDTADTDQTINPEDFNMYKSFYEKVTSDFKANGKIVKGIKDPDKHIMAQQKAFGIEKKYRAFKKDKPVLLTLEKYGMRGDTEKLNLALAIVSGDKEAMKANMKAHNIDPDELDMDEINYSNESRLVSESQVNIDETMEMAREYGIEDKVSKVFGKEWDDKGFEKVLKNPAGKAIIMEHMADGRYDEVAAKMTELSRIDVTGQFEEMDSYDKYDFAMKELAKDYAATAAKSKSAGSKEQTQSKEPARTSRDAIDAEVKAEKKKIAEAKKKADYQRKLEARNKRIDEERKKASSVSNKKKSQSNKKKKEVDPLKLSDEEMDKMLNSW